MSFTGCLVYFFHFILFLTKILLANSVGPDQMPCYEGSDPGRHCLPRNQLSLVTRKLVFGVCDQVRLKSVCSATENGQDLEILDIASIDIILSKKRTTKTLIRLHGCAG